MVSRAVALFIQNFSGSVNSVPIEQYSSKSVTFENVGSAFFLAYISRGSCWVCQLCYPGFVKSNEGKHGCSKCPTNSIPNKNQIKRLKFQQQYFIISDFQQVTAVAFPSVGIVYTLCFLAVFMFYQDTPISIPTNPAFNY